MVLMTERDRLWLTNSRISDEWRALNDVQDPAQNDNDKDCTKNGGT